MTRDAAPPQAPASTTVASSIPVQRASHGPGTGTEGWGVVVVLAALAAAAVAVVWVRRRAGLARRLGIGRRAAGALRVTENCGLTAIASVHVVEWNGRRLLVGATEGCLSLLAAEPQETQLRQMNKDGA